MKKKLVSLVLCSAMVLGMSMPVMADDKITIGSVIMNNSGEWFAEVMKGQEDAAKDLGATPFQIFGRVTLPLLWPGIWSGMLFAFLLSWGNFPLSLYTTGVDNTVPKWLYSKMVAGYTPMVPTLGTMSTLGAAGLMLLGALTVYMMHRRQGRI